MKLEQHLEVTHTTAAASESHCLLPRRSIAIGGHGQGRRRLLVSNKSNIVEFFCGQGRLCSRLHGSSGNHWYHLKLRFFFEKPFKIFSYKRTASWTTVNQTMHGRSCCSDSELPNVASGNTKGDSNKTSDPCKSFISSVACKILSLNHL